MALCITGHAICNSLMCLLLPENLNLLNIFIMFTGSAGLVVGSKIKSCGHS